MKPNDKFKPRSGRFWAHVKYLSEQIGYSAKSTKGTDGALRYYELSDAIAILHSAYHDERNINIDEEFVGGVIEYMHFRTDAITRFVEPALMSKDEAQREYLQLKKDYSPKLAALFTRLKGDMRHEAYLASMVQIIAEAAFGHDGFRNDPSRLATIWRNCYQPPERSRSYEPSFAAGVAYTADQLTAFNQCSQEFCPFAAPLHFWKQFNPASFNRNDAHRRV